MCKEVGELFVKYRPQNDDRRVDAGLPKRDAFIDRDHSHARHALPNQRFGCVHRPVAIGIGLDDRQDVAAGREDFPELSYIVGECGKIDGDAGWEKC